MADLCVVITPLIALVFGTIGAWRRNALFKTRTGREAGYHVAIEETPEWAYLGEPLVPLRGFPGVVWERSKRKKQPSYGGLF